IDCISLQRNDLSGLRYLRAPPAAVATSVPPGSRMFCSCFGIHLVSSRIRPKVRDIVGLYLNPPDKAIVLSVDEKSQIQALDPAKPAASAQHRRPGSRATNVPLTSTGSNVQIVWSLLVPGKVHQYREATDQTWRALCRSS